MSKYSCSYDYDDENRCNLPTDASDGRCEQHHRYADVHAWLNDMEPRTFYEFDIVERLRDFGFSVDFKESRHGAKFAEISKDGRIASVWLRSWDDDFNSLVGRGLPFFVLDVNHKGDVINKTKNGTGYGITEYSEDIIKQLGFMGVGYIVKNEKSMNSLTCHGSDIIRAVAMVLTGDAPGDKFMGVGFAAQANLEAIQKALQIA